jgi:hypothetical protein
MPSNDPAEHANVIAYLALCDIRDIELEEPEELRRARQYLHGQLQPAAALDPEPSWRQPFDDFEAAPRDLQDRIVLEAVGAHRRTSIQINDVIAKESPGCRCCGDETRKVLDRLVAAGELDREPWKEGPCRYRWFRRVALDLADLERAFEAAA